MTRIGRILLGVLVLGFPFPPAVAAVCGPCTSDGSVASFLCPEAGDVNTGSGCGGFPSCQTPVLAGPILDFLPESDGQFTVRLTVNVTAPRNHEQENSALWPLVFWYTGSTAPPPGSGNACLFGPYDRASTYVQRQNVTCAGGDFGTFSMRASNCACAAPALLTGMRFQVAAGSPPLCGGPPPSKCPNDESCSLCLGPGGSASPGSGGPGVGPPGSGPGARLRYASGGVGFPGWPGSAAWSAALGRGWSHDHAERIVPDPDDSHVWLLTKYGTFREFSGLAGGVYTTVKPSDEYRQLTRTAAGWELRELDGTLHAFDAAGLWTGTTDRNGNAMTATYAAGRLAAIAFPDGRNETFSYHPSGKLASITETGVGGSATRTWLYTWSGDNLTRIDRPDGTAWEFRYDDTRQPNYMTRMDLVGTHLGRRVEGAWELDAVGNILETWKGDPVSTGPNAVETYTFQYDHGGLPAKTLVTDPLGKVITYTLGRDTLSRKPRLDKIQGDCPACGVGPNATLFYDPAHPLLPTRTIDGRGIETQTIYNPHGRMTSRTEAAGTPLARLTTYQYGAAGFPAFPTRIEAPSTSGGSGGGALRTTVLSYNPAGDLETRTVQGAEAGGSFSLSTSTTFNAAGQPLSADPPGYGTADRMSYTYDPARGNLLPLTRTDPLVGTTTFGYDGFNRRTSVTDPNGVETVTTYDALDRVTSVTQKGATPAEDLVTTHVYNGFGDLFRTVLPRGNVLEYGYDAAGRLVSIERKPDAGTPGERTLYTLDAYGHRTKEQLQRWTGAAWVTASFTDFVYSTRCHLDKTVHADGTVTEYAYDCDGNLEKVWDAKHPRGSNPNPTQLYAYDALNRLSSVTQPWTGAGGGTAATFYGYDVQDHLTGVTDAEGNVTTYGYSDRDLMTAQVSPASGTTTYAFNEHGELTSEIDARGIVTARTVDPLDRVTAVTYPNPASSIGYTYDDPGVPFSKGRLTRITRNGEVVDYRYDRFGRILQDGALAYGYDANGNPASLVYPGGVEALTTYDFADRPATLLARRAGQPDQPLVTGSSYLPSGPLSGLTLANGRTEARAFNNRYFPSGLTLGGLLNWTYSTDAVGNILSITDTLSSANNRTFGYQDVHYFLTQGNGPWGPRAWTYDKIGNRLTEARGAVTDTYSYQPNGAAGRTPILSQVQLGTGGTRTYHFGPAGHLDRTALGADTTLFLNDDAGRLAALERPITQAGATFRYDGRDHLSLADSEALSFRDGFDTGDVCAWSGAIGLISVPVCTIRPAVRATYSSEGLLHALSRNVAPEQSRVFYFAGRPVAQLDVSGGTETWKWLTTDHLGTPVAATGTGGALLWQGGFEPFGADWSGAGGAGVFLRLPGQWEEGVWGGSGEGLFYNVHRWYGKSTGRYAEPDLVRSPFAYSDYLYVASNPLSGTDQFGLFQDVIWQFNLDNTCALHWGREGQRRGRERGWRWAHCWTSCMIDTTCGRRAARLTEIEKEVLDVVKCLREVIVGRVPPDGNCWSAFQPSDFEDNARGRACPPRMSCDQQCEDMPTDLSDPGPFWAPAVSIGLP